MTIWDSLGCEIGGCGEPFFLRSQETNEPVSPGLICHSLGSHAAFGHTLPRLESKQTRSHHTGQAETDGDKEHGCVSASLLLPSMPAVAGRHHSPFLKQSAWLRWPASQTAGPSGIPASWVLIQT